MIVITFDKNDRLFGLESNLECPKTIDQRRQLASITRSKQLATPADFSIQKLVQLCGRCLFLPHSTCSISQHSNVDQLPSAFSMARLSDNGCSSINYSLARPGSFYVSISVLKVL